MSARGVSLTPQSSNLAHFVFFFFLGLPIMHMGKYHKLHILLLFKYEIFTENKLKLFSLGIILIHYKLLDTLIIIVKRLVILYSIIILF